MAYKYMPINASMFPDAKTTFVNDFAANVNDMFYTASDVWTVQRETTRGTGVCDQNVDVRITKAINALTGMQLSDDFKQLLFNGVDTSITRGAYYFFDNNFWVVTNTSNIKSITTTCTIRRCNEVLRWLDDNGGLQEWPASIDYEIARAKDNISSSAGLSLLEGLIHVYTQLNSSTAKVQANQRFLFGNPSLWVAYRNTGGGINNFQRLQTTNPTSYGLLTLIMNATEKDEQNDDLTKGIANANKYTYAITVNPSSFSGIATNIITLVPTVKLNGEVVSRTVTWSSSAPTKATVNASTGVVTLVAVGSATIRCALANNSSVYKDTTITVAASAPARTYSIRMSPTTNYILLGDNQDYTVSLYTNGTIDTDTFTFVVDTTSTAPTSCYDFTVVSGTKFNVENLAMSISKPLIIKATSVAHPATTQLFTILLKGAY